METDIGQPFQYQAPPSPPDTRKDHDDVVREDEDSTPIADMDQWQYMQPQMQMPMPMQMQMPMPPPPTTKLDLGSIDKTTLVVAFAVFLLGFFMGKTMQPVILRSH